MNSGSICIVFRNLKVYLIVRALQTGHQLGLVVVSFLSSLESFTDLYLRISSHVDAPGNTQTHERAAIESIRKRIDSFQCADSHESTHRKQSYCTSLFNGDRST